MSAITDWRLGATCLGEHQCRFLVWAPQSDSVEVHIVAPQEQWLPLREGPQGQHGCPGI